MQKSFLLSTMSTIDVKKILAKTKTNQILSTNLATTHHVGVITISKKLHNRNILFYISNLIFRIKDFVRPQVA